MSADNILLVFFRNDGEVVVVNAGFSQVGDLPEWISYQDDDNDVNTQALVQELIKTQWHSIAWAGNSIEKAVAYCKRRMLSDIVEYGYEVIVARCPRD